VAMGQISEITRQTNTGTQEAAMSVSYLAELADQLRASVATFRLPDRANEMIDVFPGMTGVPALLGGNADQFYQQDMAMGMNNDWNQGFSSDFLSLPQPQESENSGSFQFAFNNLQDYGGQQGFSGIPQHGSQQYGNQLGFDGQQIGNQMNPGGQQFGSYPNFGEMNGFESQQNFDAQQQFNLLPETGFGSPNQAVFPVSNQTPDVPQQNFGSQQEQSMAAQQRWRNSQQNQQSYGQEQVPFPNNGYTGQ